jgi:Domain of unknown function (DUF222)
MEIIADLDTAQAAVRVACDAVSRVRDTLFFRFEDPDVLLLARDLERLSRLVYTAQIHLVGDLHNRGAAGTRGCTSTSAMIRDALVISPGDAKGRVNAAKAVIAQETVTGVVIDPTLPHLRAAVDDGRIGVEQIRITETTMRKIPAQVDPVTRDSCEHTLVEHGQIMEPKRFARFARDILLIVDPNGDLDKDPSDRVELSIGTRNPETGMTRFTGQLDDEGVELLTQAIDGQHTPQHRRGTGPAITGEPPRPRPERSVAPVVGSGCGTDPGWGTPAHHPDDGFPGPEEQGRVRHSGTWWADQRRRGPQVGL